MRALTLSLFEHSSGRERLPSGWVAPTHVLPHNQHGSLRRQTFDLRQLRLKHQPEGRPPWFPERAPLPAYRVVAHGYGRAGPGRSFELRDTWTQRAVLVVG
jgi:hypothetical protein